MSLKDRLEEEKWKKLELKAKYKLEEKEREEPIREDIKKLLMGKKELERETGLKAEVEYVRIDTKRYNKNIDKKKAAAIKKRHNIKGPMLLYVGRISPHKGIHLLIKAFRIVNTKLPDAKLVIVGKHTFDDYSKKLKRLANQNVLFAGFVPDEELPYY